MSNMICYKISDEGITIDQGRYVISRTREQVTVIPGGITLVKTNN